VSCQLLFNRDPQEVLRWGWIDPVWSLRVSRG